MDSPCAQDDKVKDGPCSSVKSVPRESVQQPQLRRLLGTPVASVSCFLILVLLWPTAECRKPMADSRVFSAPISLDFRPVSS